MRSFKSDLVPAPHLCLCWSFIPKDKKIGLEIGAGNGLFALNFTRKNKDWFLIALERTLQKSRAFSQIEKTFGNHRQQLFYTRADGVNVVTHWVPDSSLDGIFFIYPNPYIKEKQKNLRWHNMPFFFELLKKLKKGGQVELRTNLKWYSEEFLKKITDTKHFNLIQNEVLKSTHQPETNFEKKYLDRGESCYQLIFKKI